MTQNTFFDFCKTMLVIALSTMICGSRGSKIVSNVIFDFLVRTAESPTYGVLTAWLIWLVDGPNIGPKTLVSNNIKAIFVLFENKTASDNTKLEKMFDTNPFGNNHKKTE